MPNSWLIRPRIMETAIKWCILNSITTKTWYIFITISSACVPEDLPCDKPALIGNVMAGCVKQQTVTSLSVVTELWRHMAPQHHFWLPWPSWLNTMFVRNKNKNAHQHIYSTDDISFVQYQTLYSPLRIWWQNQWPLADMIIWNHQAQFMDPFHKRLLNP